jgi:vacuolar-type H+-ATPase subunit H
MSFEILIYILCGIIIIQIAEIVFLVTLYQKKSAALDFAEKDATKALAKIIDNANKKAEQIIQNAVNKSEDIIYDSESFSSKVNKEMEFVFSDAMGQHKKTFDEVLNQTFTDFKENFATTKSDFSMASEKVLAEMESLAKREFSSFQAEMRPI